MDEPSGGVSDAATAPPAPISDEEDDDEEEEEDDGVRITVSQGQLALV